MIHYHGLNISPNQAALAALSGGHAFVGFPPHQQFEIVLDVCQSFAVDNGAFSAWKAGKATDWKRYYDWVRWISRLPSFDFAVIPDVIDGTESENDDLLDAWPWRTSKDSWIGAPVWHLHESIERLERLACGWPRVCIGSSGEYAVIGTPAWWTRMEEAFSAICDRDGRPITKVHGLRMMDVDVFTRFPFASVDSTNVGRNVGIETKWRGTYVPPDKAWRASIIRARIEAHQSPQYWTSSGIQLALSEQGGGDDA